MRPNRFARTRGRVFEPAYGLWFESNRRGCVLVEVLRAVQPGPFGICEAAGVQWSA